MRPAFRLSSVTPIYHMKYDDYDKFPRNTLNKFAILFISVVIANRTTICVGWVITRFFRSKTVTVFAFYHFCSFFDFMIENSLRAGSLSVLFARVSWRWKSSRREEWGEQKWACTKGIEFWILRVRPRTQHSDWFEMTGSDILYYCDKWWYCLRPFSDY